MLSGNIFVFLTIRPVLVSEFLSVTSKENYESELSNSEQSTTESPEHSPFSLVHSNVLNKKHYTFGVHRFQLSLCMFSSPITKNNKFLSHGAGKAERHRENQLRFSHCQRHGGH